MAKTSAPYHHGMLRARLVELALVALEADGVLALSLRDLARAAGVSPTAPYRHFKDKNALLTALVVDGFRRFTAALEARRVAGPKPSVRALYDVYVDFALAQPALFRLMFSSVTTENLRSPECEAEGLRALDQLRHAVCAEFPKETARPEAREALVQSIWAYIHGLAHLILEGFFPLDAWRGPAGEELKNRIPGLKAVPVQLKR